MQGSGAGLFDSLDDIKALTGPDYESAVVPDERRRYLSRFDAKAVHYEVASTHGLISSFA